MFNYFRITFLEDCEAKIVDFDYYRPWRTYINLKRKFSKGESLVTDYCSENEIMSGLTKKGDVTFSANDSHVDRFETSERVCFTEIKVPLAKIKIEGISREEIGVKPNDGKF